MDEVHAALSAQITELQWRIAALEAQRDAYRQQRDALRGALEAVEWVSSNTFCPWCGNARMTGHDANCPRQAALALVSE